MLISLMAVVETDRVEGVPAERPAGWTWSSCASAYNPNPAFPLLIYFDYSPGWQKVRRNASTLSSVFKQIQHLWSCIETWVCILRHLVHEHNRWEQKAKSEQLHCFASSVPPRSALDRVRLNFPSNWGIVMGNTQHKQTSSILITRKHTCTLAHTNTMREHRFVLYLWICWLVREQDRNWQSSSYTWRNIYIYW